MLVLFPASFARRIYTCLVCGWQARTSSCLVRNLPKVTFLFLRRSFVHCNLFSCACFAPVWKWSVLVDSACPGSVLQAFANLCCMCVVLCAFIASLWESRPVVMPWKLQAITCFFLALKVQLSLPALCSSQPVFLTLSPCSLFGDPQQ